MARSYKPINPALISTYSIQRREHKTRIVDAAPLPEPGASARQLLESMPDFLAVNTFRKIVGAVAEAVRADRPVVAAFGAHLIKVGCGPILVDLIRKGVIRAIACNGACAIHDVELATCGETSEEVADTIRDGTFGMVAETMEFFDAAAAHAKTESIGLGDAVADLLIERKAPGAETSVFVAARKASIPACVHVALGTDTVHASAGADGAALGAASLHDFRLICDVVSDLGGAGKDNVGGVWLNIGSAVLLPEVFLKAVAVARNLGADLDRMTTANFDMIKHYRPSQNVIGRPVAKGRGHEVIGHHEIMLPLFRMSVLEELAASR